MVSAGEGGGCIYEVMAYCAMSQFLRLGASDKTVKFCFLLREYYEKLGHIPKPHVPKFRPDLSARLRDIAEKETGPQDAETDSSCMYGRLWIEGFVPFPLCPDHYQRRSAQKTKHRWTFVIAIAIFV